MRANPRLYSITFIVLNLPIKREGIESRASSRDPMTKGDVSNSIGLSTDGAEAMASTETLRNLVVLEGLDGSGTTTQMKLLAERCEREGVSCVTTCEPSAGVIGALARRVLKRDVALDPKALALLFAADRAQHLADSESGMRAAAFEGRLVICDRYLFSSLAYQSIDCGFDWVFDLNRDFPLPEVLIFLDVPPEECNRRMATRRGVELFEGLELQERILAFYRRGIEARSAAGMRVGRIDGVGAREEIHEKIWSFIGRRPIQRM